MLLEQREVFRGRVIRVSVDRVRLPNDHVADLEIVHHPGGAAVVALDAAQRICLIHQFRHAAGGYCWELPAGKLEPPEAAVATAQRELAEEAGMQARDWSALGQYLSSPGVFTETIHLFLARDLSPVPTELEAGEVLVAHWLPLEEALDRVTGGAIRDGKTQLGILRAAMQLGLLRRSVS